MIGTMIAAGAAALLSPQQIDVLVQGSQPRVLRGQALVAGLQAPQRRVERRRHYCFDDRWSEPAAVRRVCRTRADWRRFGLDPLA